MLLLLDIKQRFLVAFLPILLLFWCVEEVRGRLSEFLGKRFRFRLDFESFSIEDKCSFLVVLGFLEGLVGLRCGGDAKMPLMLFFV